MKLFGHLSAHAPEDLAARGDLHGLAHALTDRNRTVRRRAAQLLGLAAISVQHPSLARISSDDVAGILRWLGSDRGAVDPRRLAEARTLCSEPLVAMLRARAADPAERAAVEGERQGAAEAAAAFGDERVVEPLIALLQDTSISPLAYVRQAAAQALGAIGDPGAAGPLGGELLRPGNASLATESATALERLGDAGTDTLLTCLAEAAGDSAGRASGSASPGAIAARSLLHIAALGTGSRPGDPRVVSGVRAFVASHPVLARAYGFGMAGFRELGVEIPHPQKT